MRRCHAYDIYVEKGRKKRKTRIRADRNNLASKHTLSFVINERHVNSRRNFGQKRQLHTAFHSQILRLTTMATGLTRIQMHRSLTLKPIRKTSSSKEEYKNVMSMFIFETGHLFSGGAASLPE